MSEQVRPIEQKDKFYRSAELLARKFIDGSSLKPVEMRFPLEPVQGMDSLAEVVVIVAVTRREPNKSGVVFDGKVMF